MLTEWAFKGFIGIYYMMRYLRGDTTLLIYVLKLITSWLYQRNAKLYNRFGYIMYKKYEGNEKITNKLVPWKNLSNDLTEFSEVRNKWINV